MVFLHIHITVRVQVILDSDYEYMDYTDDRGMFMFSWSKKQNGTIFLSGGSRASPSIKLFKFIKNHKLASK
jgi:hypothetical protein